MALNPEKLRILTFPQRIAGKQFEVNLLLLPTQRSLNQLLPFNSQLHPGNMVDLPKFISAIPKFQLRTIKGLSSYPYSDELVLNNEGSSSDTFSTTLTFPNNLPLWYEGLAEQFDINPLGTGAGDPLPDADGIRKYLPRSYRKAFNFTTPRTEYAKIDDSYHCAIKSAPEPDPNFANSSDKITWGRVIGFCLRQPLLAKKIGLLHQLKLDLPAADYFVNGGWVYFELTSPTSEFGIAAANVKVELKYYAARIPAISTPRQLFGALLFPVVEKPPQPNGDFDTLKIEASDYDDGFAKIVHAFQPVSANLLSEEPDGIHVQKDAGVRLGWDDEQILIWQNRQMLADPNTANVRIDAPLGVFSYRVDVREKKTPATDWTSLVEVRNKAELKLAGATISKAHTSLETGVQVFPSKINADPSTTFWLPSFFTHWYGPSLVLPDDRAAQLDASGALGNPGLGSDLPPIKARPNQKGGLYEPVLPRDPELKYGKQYQFRVRLADLTGGGPKIGDNELNDSPATSAEITFQRYVAPKQLKVTPVNFVPDPASRTSVRYLDTEFEIERPRLGYPALLFTEMDTAAAFQKLLDDKMFLHPGNLGGQNIKEYREVGFFDPDVDKFMVVVEVKSLLMDNGDSLNQREPYIPLYTTLRTFDPDPEVPFNLILKYRDANVIKFGVDLLGDLGLSRADIDGRDELVLPRSRDIRITLYPFCSEKPALPAYFGFEKTQFTKQFVRIGEPTQFFVREDAESEVEFFHLDLESKELQGLYLQPDPPAVNNPLTFIKVLVAGKDLEQSPIVERLAAQLNLDTKGLTLIGKPGERVQFGCSNRIRHTLAPDNSSLTLATSGDLLNHWLCVLSFEINRDWTWDGLSQAGIEITRETNFTKEPATLESGIVGYLQLKNTISRVATTPKPDRSHTRVIFIDAVEPKKDLTKPTTVAHPFPNTIEVNYSLRPDFIPSVLATAEDDQTEVRDLTLPVTTIPAQVPKVAAVGIALSPYTKNEDYSETTVRQRYLWFEFEEPIADPNDTYFARVLSYAPDPLLTFSNIDQLFLMQSDPPLAIAPELIRVITHDQGNDGAGIDAMQEMIAETADPSQPMIKLSPVHYLLPLPPGLHNESNELFGFFTYELRVGHTDGIWSTAKGRFGHPKRVNGAQHPAPPLKCLVDRTPKEISVTAQYATSVLNGKDVTSKPPKTEIWCMLYAQARQADGKGNRNILLSEKRLAYIDPAKQPVVMSKKWTKLVIANALSVNLDAPPTGTAQWSEAEIRLLLLQFNLAKGTGLSVLAVEMMPRYEQYIKYFYRKPPIVPSVRPLSQELGKYRILRTSRLVSAPEIC